MDRYTAGHRRGVVCVPHFAAAEAGREVLAEGGNALEAMVAMAAMIAVVYPHMNHLGGDGFWVVHEPSGKVRALMAAGAAGARATLAHYRDAGHDRVPTRGPLAALTVPAAVAGWMLALEAAKAQGGRLPVPDVLAAAIKQARGGVEVSIRRARIDASPADAFVIARPLGPRAATHSSRRALQSGCPCPFRRGSRSGSESRPRCARSQPRR